MGKHLAKQAWLLAIAVLMVGTVANAASPEPLPATESATGAAPSPPPGAQTQPVRLSRIASRTPVGQVIGRMKAEPFCTLIEILTFNEQNGVQTASRLNDVFQKEVNSAGFKVLSDTPNLFGDNEEVYTEYLIAALVDIKDVDICEIVNWNLEKIYRSHYKYEIEWQIYSNIEKKVVARIKTEGVASGPKTRDGIEPVARGALAINVRKLLASPEFRDRFMTAPQSPPTTVRRVLTAPGQQTPMYYVNRGDGPGSVADAVGGVVALFTTRAMGTGFLIDETGLLLTNHHVIEGEKFVKVRWADGVETLGEVLRSDKKRDIAVLKTDPRGRKPLKLSLSTPPVGDDVFAIGTPLDAQFQSTVTRGVVSASNRVYDGMSYIQSDVTVNHGSSGGPLLNKSGQVVGLTDLGFAPEGVPTGLNLFIPIRDGLDFLALTPGPTVAAAK